MSELSSARRFGGGEKTQSLQTDCSSNCQTPEVAACMTKHRAEVTSDIDHGHQARVTEFYKTPVMKT
jgi:hypothetical protein